MMFEALFQTFEEPETGVALTARLSAFREELARRNLTGFVVPRADQQQNEYVPPSDERLAWLTGFTGSAGLAIVLAREAAVFVDGRYTLQAAKQVDAKAWRVEPLVEPPPEAWLGKHLVGYACPDATGIETRSRWPSDDLQPTASLGIVGCGKFRFRPIGEAERQRHLGRSAAADAKLS